MQVISRALFAVLNVIHSFIQSFWIQWPLNIVLKNIYVEYRKSQSPDVYTLKNKTPYLVDFIANMELI